MTPERWVRIKEIFAEVIEAPESERESIIGKACAGDDELATEMRRLLSQHASSEGFLDHPALGSPALIPPPGRSPALEPGQMLSSRFRITRFIARGGMGEVYEAHDTELDEAVALKTIRAEIASDPHVVAQFRREVRQARKISSPYVCRVNEVFTAQTESGRSLVYLTMQLLVGESLAERLSRRGRMDPAAALPLLRQMGEALQAAHRAGIIHRDFKSGNVMLVHREDGTEQAVITDFGLARPVVPTDSHSLRDAFSAAGTPAYMAPEQAGGKNLTTAVDVYALGVVAYEMVTGRLPQPGAPPRSIAPDLDPRWNTAILRCLERDPARRFANATELAQTITAPKPQPLLARRQWIVAALVIALIAVAIYLVAVFRPQAARPDSVAVLPFQTIGDTPGRDYYADGITEEVIDSLTNIRALHVIARESSFHYKTVQPPLAQIGRELRVAKLLTGTVQRAGGRLRIFARLVRASDGAQLWSQTYDGNEARIFEFQQKIAKSIAAALQVNLAGFQAGTPAPPTPNPNAHDLYLWGRFHLNKRTNEGLQLARGYFEKAIAADPNYAEALVGLADTDWVIAERGTLPPLTVLAEAKQAALKAETLNPQLADVYASLGQIASVYDRDSNAAEAYFKKALELDPNLLTAHQRYSYMLLKLRRFDESLVHAKRAVDLDPLSNPAHSNLAVLYFYMHDAQDALAECRKLLELDPHHAYAPMLMGLVFAQQHRFQEAFEAFDKTPPAMKADPWGRRVLGEIQAMAGQAEQARQTIQDLTARSGVPPSYVAIVYATLGDKDHAFEWLERAYSEGDGMLSLLEAYPAFDSLRTDPRYKSLATRLGL